MQNRLIDILLEREAVKDVNAYDRVESLADFLLEKGVIVPPCKIGQTVYYPYYNRVLGEPDKLIVETIKARKYKDSNFVFVCECGFKFLDTDIGKTVFLTREEAEQALKEVQG